MKRIIQIVICFCVLCTGLCFAFAADGEGVVNHVYVNGEAVEFDVQPFTTAQGRTFVPLRGVVEKLGATVAWKDNEKIKSAFVFRDGMSIQLKIGEPTIEIRSFDAGLKFEYTSNPIKTAIDPQQESVVPMIRNNRTLLPLRAVCEALGATISWDGDNRDVYITSPSELMTDSQKEKSKSAFYYTDYSNGLQLRAKEAESKTMGAVNLTIPADPDLEKVLTQKPLSVTINDLTNVDPATGTIKVSKKALIKGYTFLPVGDYTIVVDPETVPDGYRVASADKLKVKVNAKEPVQFDIIVKNITIDADKDGGTVEVDNPNAKKGDKVKVTVTPNEGYSVTEPISVKDAYGNDVKVAKDNSFKMPDSAVTIKVDFKKDEVTPDPSDKPDDNPSDKPDDNPSDNPSDKPDDNPGGSEDAGDEGENAGK